MQNTVCSTHYTGTCSTHYTGTETSTHYSVHIDAGLLCSHVLVSQVYENHDGSGPLLRVFSGQQRNVSFTVPADGGVYLSFRTSPSTMGGGGMELEYAVALE